MRSLSLKKLFSLKLLNDETGIALTTVIFFVAIVTIISASVAFTTTNQLINTETASKRTLAFNVAEAGLERLIGVYGQDFPTSIPQIETIIYDNEPLNGGSYTLTVVKDTDNVNAIKIKSIGTIDGHQRTIEVILTGMPEVFNYAVASNTELELENDSDAGTAYALINGNIHANGGIDLDGGQIYVNTPTYDDGTGSKPNPYYDSNWKVSATGGINPNDPTYIGGYDPTDNSPINFPKIDYNYYKDQANFTNQQVFVGASSDEYTVAEFNAEFTPTPPYTSSIVVLNDRDISITGQGTITATILTGDSADNMGRMWVNADPGKTINFVPAIGMALTADRFEFSGNVNIGTEGQGAIVIATGEIEIEEAGDSSPANFTLWGSFLLGQNGDSDVDIEIDGLSNAQNHIEFNYTDSVHRNLPPGWSNWGSTLMFKDNWKES